MAAHPRSAATRARILVRRVHLWLGLSLGLLFAVLGLTGSALVFYTGIDAALHPVVEAGPGDVPPGLTSPVWDRALATGRARWHHPGDKWTLEVTGEGGPIPARYYPASGQGHHTDRMMVWFSGDGTRIVRAEPWGGYLMSWLYQLHMALLAGDLGGQVVGWSGVAMLVLLVSGIAAWWPRGSWRKALAFKRNAAPIRRLRDLHKLSGLWSMALLFVLVATGVLLALPAVTQALLAPATIPAPKSAGVGDRQIAIVQALDGAHRALHRRFEQADAVAERLGRLRRVEHGREHTRDSEQRGAAVRYRGLPDRAHCFRGQIPHREAGQLLHPAPRQRLVVPVHHHRAAFAPRDAPEKRRERCSGRETA